MRHAAMCSHTPGQQSIKCKSCLSTSLARLPAALVSPTSTGGTTGYRFCHTVIQDHINSFKMMTMQPDP